MRFPLSFEGPLPSSGNDDPLRPKESKLKAVWAIRDYINPQLKKLFETHHALQGRTEESRVLMHALIPRIVVDGHLFFPLARSSFKLKCGLDITMLVNHDPASVVTRSGDLDNRLKTLFDGLRTPASHQEIKRFKDVGAPDADDYFCLLQDDGLITSLRIETLRNLAPSPTAGDDHVKINLMVTIEPAEHLHVNRAFRGD